ncbi:ABC transporter permease subunit [Amycolatopsis ultiminotia]|uniref:ABC transporter permease subunit n=1 Tax=Amycolatopsis ultiminotia TaxID=543629 RepID=A0ABP6XSF4_9PSEU
MTVAHEVAAGRADTGRGKAGLLGAVRSEWTKFRTLRSSWWTLGVAFALLAAGVIVASVSTRSQHAAGGADAFSSSAPYVAAQTADFLVQWAAVILAVLMIAGEYSTGSIRTTLQWVPNRGRMLMSKVLVLVPILFLVGLAVGVVGIGGAIIGLGEFGEPYPLSYATEVVLGIALYLPMVGVFCLGLATMLRSAASATVAAFVLLLILPSLLPSVGLKVVGAMLQGKAGSVLMSGIPNEYYGRPGAIVIALCWAVAAVLGGYLTLRRRDV